MGDNLGTGYDQWNSNRSVGASLTLEIQFYSHLLEYNTTLVACTGANWQQYNQATVAKGILERCKAESPELLVQDAELQQRLVVLHV